MYFLDGAVQMCAGLVVYIHHHRTQSGGLLNVALRLHNHEVHVEWFLANLRYSFEYRETKRDVRYKDAIHDVEMQPVGIAAVDHVDVVGKMREVGGQQRG